LIVAASLLLDFRVNLTHQEKLVEPDLRAGSNAPGLSAEASVKAGGRVPPLTKNKTGCAL
jgi:hypothetical protein